LSALLGFEIIACFSPSPIKGAEKPNKPTPIHFNTVLCTKPLPRNIFGINLCGATKNHEKYVPEYQYTNEFPTHLMPANGVGGGLCRSSSADPALKLNPFIILGVVQSLPLLPFPNEPTTPAIFDGGFDRGLSVEPYEYTMLLSI
jgi:hypothetical protein